MAKETIDCSVHGKQEKVVISIDGGPNQDKCVRCAERLETMKLRIVYIGGLNLPLPRGHEGRYVYGQD